MQKLKALSSDSVVFECYLLHTEMAVASDFQQTMWNSGPHLAKFYGATCISEEKVSLVMEYMPGGDLERYLRSLPEQSYRTDRCNRFPLIGTQQRILLLWLGECFYIASALLRLFTRSKRLESHRPWVPPRPAIYFHLILRQSRQSQYFLLPR